MKFSLKDNIKYDDILKYGLEDGDEVTNEINELAYQYANDTAPVDSGELKSSIFMEGSNGEYSMGATADYAIFVEFGTSNMPAQPFIYPSYNRAVQDIKNKYGIE